MSRLHQTFERLKAGKRGGLVTYLTAGDPDADAQAVNAEAAAEAAARHSYGKLVAFLSARTHDIAANRCGWNEVADRFADPAHPKQTLPARANGLRKKGAPGKSIKKNRYKMKGSDTGNGPTGGRHRTPHRHHPLPNEQDGK